MQSDGGDDLPTPNSPGAGSTPGYSFGAVIAFDAHVGLGRIRSDAGDEMMFHCAEIADGSRSIEVAERVRFRAGSKFSRPEAFDISSM